MPEADRSPDYFSWAFHTRFFPSVLRRRVLSPRGVAYESPFAHHTPMEFTILVILSLMACVLGYAAAIDDGSIPGWFFAVLGTAGLLFSVIHSFMAHHREKPSFDHFRAGIFFFFFCLGFTLGLAAGHAYQFSYGLRLLCGFAGAAIGYSVGIVGGLWIQYLGWLSELLDLFAGLAVAGMVLLVIILLL